MPRTLARITLVIALAAAVMPITSRPARAESVPLASCTAAVEPLQPSYATCTIDIVLDQPRMVSFALTRAGGFVGRVNVSLFTCSGWFCYEQGSFRRTFVPAKPPPPVQRWLHAGFWRIQLNLPAVSIYQPLCVLGGIPNPYSPPICLSPFDDWPPPQYGLGKGSVRLSASA